MKSKSRNKSLPILNSSMEVATPPIEVKPQKSKQTWTQKRMHGYASPKLNVHRRSRNEIQGLRQNRVTSRNNTVRAMEPQKFNRARPTQNIQEKTGMYNKNKNSVAECIMLMRRSAAWPDTKCPLFSDNAAKITLRLRPDQRKPIDRRSGFMGVQTLPNPLSLRRSVCLFSNPVDLETEDKALKILCTALGVRGESKVIAVSELTANNDVLLATVAKFDSLLLTPGARKEIKPEAKLQVQVFPKRFLEIDLSEQPAAELRRALSITNLSWDAEAKFISLTVGDSGLSPEELEANIIYVLGKLHKHRFYPHGLRTINATVFVGKGYPWRINVAELANEFDKQHFLTTLKQQVEEGFDDFSA